MTPTDNTIQKGEYVVEFDFTTFDFRKSTATGRSGRINIKVHRVMDGFNMEEVKQLCVNEMLRLKPKWNILMLDVKSINPFKPKKIK